MAEETAVQPEELIVDRLTADLAAGASPLALEEFAQLRPADRAEILSDLPRERRLELIDSLPDLGIAEVLPELEDDDLEGVLSQMDAERLARVLDQAPADAAADAIQVLEADDQGAVLGLMTTAARVRPLLGYQEDDAGGIMLPAVVALRQNITVETALRFLRRTQPSGESIYYLYVVDETERLAGIVSLRELVIAQPATLLEDVMDRKVVSVRIGTDQEQCARLLQRYNLLALPVLDDNDRLVGSITVDDVMDVVEAEATEDMFRMVGVGDDERALGPLRQSIRRRLPWLLVNLVTAFAAAAVVGIFEPTIEAIAILAVFMPVVAGEGGNATTQTVTIVVRGLATGDLELADGWRVLRREVMLGAVHGLIVGIATGLIAWLIVGQPILGIVIAIAMVLNLVAAGIAGASVPLGLKLAKVDPALASTVIVTTVTDVLGFFFFLGLATLFFAQLSRIPS